MVYINDYLASQNDGVLWRGDFNSGEYLAPMSYGLWRNSSAEFTISGFVNPESSIEATVERIITIVSSGAIGETSIEAQVNLIRTINISGEVTGVGSVSSDTNFESPMIISGSVCGIGSTKYRFNQSKQKAFNPILVQQNLPYNVGDCPIAAIEYEGFSPNKIINLISTEDSVYENTNDFHVYETCFKSNNNFTVNHYPFSTQSSGLIDYLVTDYRSDNGNGEPLFYQYELFYDSYSEDNTESVIQIYKNNEYKLKPGIDYLIQYSDDLLSNSNARYSSTSWKATKSSNNSYRIRILFPSEVSDTDIFYTIEYVKVVNSINSPQKELIELRPLYTTSDFGVGESGIYLKSSTNIPSNVTTLHLQKNPYKRIAPLDITVVKDNTGSQAYLPDQTSSWNLRLNTGSFLVGSGFYTSVDNKFYKIDEQVPSGIPVTNVKPEIVNDFIIRLPAAPVLVDTSDGKYKYPDYKIDIYDKVNNLLTDVKGKIAIETNGTTRSDIKILSIDREKGYMLLDTPVNPIDELELTYYLQNDGYVVLQDLELNPKVSLPSGTTSLHISGFGDGIGLGIRPYDSANPQTTYPFIYDLNQEESSRTCYTVSPATVPSEIINWSGDFITIAELGINKLNTTLVKLTDARKIGGGITQDNRLDSWFRDKFSDSLRYFEKKWYTDIGKYEGDALSNSSNIIINIPSSTLSGIYQNWEDHYIDNMDNADDARRKANDEYNFWLDQTIRKYISAGSDYILITTNSGDFNSSNIERLNF